MKNSMVSLEFAPVRVDCVLYIRQEKDTFQSKLIVITALGTSISLRSSKSFILQYFSKDF